MKGRKHSNVANGDYVRLIASDGKSYAQLAARRETAILENVPAQLKVTGLKLAD